MCGYPAFKVGGIDIKNIPTLHQKIHDFDYFKKIGYQMNSRLFTDNGESVAEIQAKRGKGTKLEKMEQDKPQKRQCRNPKCREFFKNWMFLKGHIMKVKRKGHLKDNKCYVFYSNAKADYLQEIKDMAEQETRLRKKMRIKTLLEKNLEDGKKHFKKVLERDLKIHIDQPCAVGQGGTVENGPNTMAFLHPDNRKEAINSFNPINDEERRNLDLMLTQAHIIIGVTNCIGRINVPKFQKYVQDAHEHWLNSFKKFTHIKSSVHWNLAHCADLIAQNDGYTLAEVSENSVENWIKYYRDATENHARSTSMGANNTDCLRAMWLHTMHDIRQFDKPSKKPYKEDDEVTKIIHSFFEINEDGKKWSFREE